MHFERPDFAVYKGASGGGFEKIRPKKANEEKVRGFGGNQALLVLPNKLLVVKKRSLLGPLLLVFLEILKIMAEMENVLEYTRLKPIN